MSVETLKQDLQQVVASIPAGPLTTAPDIAAYLRDNLVPFIESVVAEISEQDECIGALVDETEDILHEDNAAIFAGIITSAKTLVGELRVRVGGDKRVLKLIREFEILAAKGLQILDDIVIPDPDPDADPDDGGEDDDNESPAASPGAPDAGDKTDGAE